MVTTAAMIEHSTILSQMRSSSQILRQLLPGHGNLDLELVIRHTATTARNRTCTSWQEAWNAATGATPTRPGLFQFQASVTCPGCNGKKINMRRGTWCAECQMRGRVTTTIRQVALYAPIPGPHTAPNSSR